jgi:hypothetical protein
VNTTQLEDRAVVRVAGVDSAQLLHNVLTLDMPGVERHGSGYGALLTPQGKILWDFVLHKTENAYAVDLRADQAEPFAKRLAIYRLRAKVEIAAAADLAVFAQWPASPEHRTDPRLPDLGSRWVGPVGSVTTSASADDWHAHRVSLTIPEGGIDFVFGDTFPHDAAMDSLNGVAFDKGCYVGQEVVSRMRHRGTARRRIVALEATGPLPEPGAEILAADRPVGRLGSSVKGQAIGLARLDRVRAALDAGTVITAGGVELGVTLPLWATYTWPATAATEDD